MIAELKCTISILDLFQMEIDYHMQLVKNSKRANLKSGHVIGRKPDIVPYKIAVTLGVGSS